MRYLGILALVLAATPGASAPRRPTLKATPHRAAQSAPAPHITAIVPIALRPGVNTVPGFLPDGGTARIVQAWHPNGNAHGYNVWMVLTGQAEWSPVGIAPFEDEDAMRDTIRDDPFDGERTLGSVWFARARIDGKPANIVIQAELDWSEGKLSLADHELATVNVYRFASDLYGPGEPPEFIRIAKLRTTRRYCNVDLAVRDLLGVPLDKGFSAPNTIDGCY